MKNYTIFGLIIASILLLVLFAPEDSFAQRGVEATSVDKLILKDPNLKAELAYRGIQYPTSMAFLGPNDILVLEKNEGTVKRIVDGVMLDEPLLDVSVSNFRERGMLGIAIAEENENGQTFVFLYYTESEEDGDDMRDENPKEPLGNRLYRYELQDSKLVNPKILLDLPTTPRGVHNGGKITIGPDNNVYLTTGDLFERRTMTQNLQSDEPLDSGIIFRVTMEGESAGSILGASEPANKIYAYGMRNSFGIDFDPATNILWDTENGPDFGDEINLVEPGFNSGWRIVQGLAERPSDLNDGFSEDQLVSSFQEKHGGLVGFLEGMSEGEPEQIGEYRDPEFVWQIPIGVTDIKFFSSDNFGEDYENNIFVGDINNGNIYYFELDGDRDELELQGNLEDKVADGFDEREAVIIGKNFGGITDLEVGPDGNLYVLSFHRSQGTVFRIESTENAINVANSTTSPDSLVPSWIKNNASWWADNQIDDGTFVEGIKFLIKEEIIIVPTIEATSETEANIPSWIKQSARWWADDIVSDTEFLNSIQYMVSTGIITLD